MRAGVIAEDNDALTERLLRDNARDEGLSYGDYCKKYGLVGPAKERQLRRHEVVESDLSEPMQHEIKQRTAWREDDIKPANGSVITVNGASRKKHTRNLDGSAE